MEKEKFIQKLMDEYNDRCNKDKKGIPVLYYFYGESGCGKSYMSYEFARTFDLIPYSTYVNNSILASRRECVRLSSCSVSSYGPN